MFCHICRMRPGWTIARWTGPIEAIYKYNFENKKKKEQKTVIITSNDKLLELQRAEEKKINKTKPPNAGHKIQRAQNKTSWFCTICDETKEEEMIQCIKCHT